MNSLMQIDNKLCHTQCALMKFRANSITTLREPFFISRKMRGIYQTKGRCHDDLILQIALIIFFARLENRLS